MATEPDNIDSEQSTSAAEPTPAGRVMPTLSSGATVAPVYRRMSKWRVLLAATASAVFGLVAFGPFIHHDFIYDDFPLVLQNPVISPEGLHQPPGPWYRFWTEPYYPRLQSVDKLYRPLTSWSLRANILLAGAPPRPEPLHIVNILLHALTCAGVAVLTCRLSGSYAAGALAGMLFATHPIHTEAVVPIYGRAEVLAGLFGAWLLARHIRPPSSQHPRGLRFHVVSTLMLLAALMSKEHAVFLWPALMLIDVMHRWREPTATRRPLREWFNTTLAPSHIGFALATTAFFLLRFNLFKWKTHLEGSRTRIWEVPMAHVGLIEHILTPFRLLWVTIVNLVWPDNLCPVWSYPALSPANHLSSDVCLGIVAAAAIVGLTVALWRRRLLSGALLAGLIVLLIIPLQVIPVVRWFYAERWFYLPTVLLAALIGAAVRGWGRAATTAGLTIALVLLPQSWNYASKFSDNLTLQREVIVRQPDNFQGRRNYASVLYYTGRYEEAVQAARQLIARFGDVHDAYAVLLHSYLQLGDGRRALEAIDKYEELRRDFPEPSLSAQRERALALIAKQRLQPGPSQP